MRRLTRVCQSPLTRRADGSTIRAMDHPSRRAVLSTFLGAASLLTGARFATAQPAAERVRVLGRHANVHMGPNTTTEVLVLAPRDTVLTVVARNKEWVQVQLTPELRKTGMVMRWYKNEDRGWMHDSTVVAVK
jgi:hypothetical protein